MLNWIRNSVLAILLLGSTAFAQGNLSVEVDTNLLMIGEWNNLNITIDVPNGVKVNWPQIGDTLGSGLEVMNIGKIDTNGTILTQSIAFTAYDSGYYQVSPLVFNIDAGQPTEPVVTSPIYVGFMAMQVDMQKGMMDIKGPLEIPFYWDMKLILIIIGNILIALIIAFFFYNRMDKVKEKLAPLKPAIPPHIVALQQLNELKDKKTFEDINQTKEYYSELTEVLRRYIEFSFGIRALESTSDEIKEGIAKHLNLSKDLETRFGDLLVTADLAKFAKVNPTPSENETYLKLAFEFVNTTLPKPTEEKEDVQ